jgi:RimJ/RimL family protein N-acetyltransferase
VYAARVTRYQVTWNELTAIEPTLDEVRTHVPALVTAYNHPRNAPLLGHTLELTTEDVLEHYENLLAAGARSFLLFDSGTFAGDGDLRGIAGGVAEFAFLIAAPEAQGKGLGTRFATMVHALAFAQGIEKIYATVVPENVASKRVFEKLGYAVDHSEAAADYGDEGDVVLSITRAAFHAPAGIAISLRS